MYLIPKFPKLNIYGKYLKLLNTLQLMMHGFLVPIKSWSKLFKVQSCVMSKLSITLFKTNTSFFYCTALFFYFWYLMIIYVEFTKVQFILKHFIDGFSSHSISTSMHIVYRCDWSSGTNPLTDNQDNRCLFWHCYQGTTLYNLTKCFSKPMADGDKQGWHYNGGINIRGLFLSMTISWR